MEGDGVGILWLEDGKERPFESAEQTSRPWLEVSADWVESASARDGRKDGPDQDDRSQRLLWV